VGVVLVGWYFSAALEWIREGCFLGETVAAAEMFSWEAMLALVILALVILASVILALVILASVILASVILPPVEMERGVSLETGEAREAEAYKCAAEECISLGLRWDSGLHRLRPGKMTRHHRRHTHLPLSRALVR